MKNSPQTTINSQLINKLKFNNYQKARDTSNWTCINRGGDGYDRLFTAPGRPTKEEK
jgi:hypothetical protein